MLKTKNNKEETEKDAISLADLQMAAVCRDLVTNGLKSRILQLSRRATYRG